MLEEMRLFARQSWIPVILDDSLEYIENLLSKKSVKNILEIGTAIGYSAICFSKFLMDDGKIDTIEIDKQRIMLAKANIDMYKLNVIRSTTFISPFIISHPPTAIIIAFMEHKKSSMDELNMPIAL